MPNASLGGGDLGVAGAEELEKLGRRLVEIGAKDLRRELLSRIRKAAKPVVEDIRESAREELPKRGGLADLIATSKLGVRTRTAGNVSVRIVATSPHDINSINAGRLRHPVFGTDTWVTQDVPKGWFEKPTQKSEPTIRTAVLDAMHTIAEQATARIT